MAKDALSGGGCADGRYFRAQGMIVGRIEAQRATRIRHLETEIRTFQNNIDKIRGGQ
jgi:hypothetical protein